jgi:Ser/Thr protein kinase RdoA (MazF antagonist)
LRWNYDDGDWVLLVLDDVDGVMPATPWRQDQLARVLRALGQLAAALTPAPAGTVPITEDLAGNFSSWHAIAGDPELAGQLGAWERAHLADLVRLESGWADAARGDTLLHADLRADNLLLTADGGVMVVDWPYAVAGTAWVDGLLFLISAAADGGADPCRAWGQYGPGRDAEPGAVDTVLAAAAGDFTCQSLLPAPQNLPFLRAHQRVKAAVAVGWLRARLTSP